MELNLDEEIFISKNSYEKLTISMATERIARLIFQLARQIDYNLNDDIKDILNKGEVYHNIDRTIEADLYKSLGLKI